MPTTSKYALPWPATSAFLRNGAASIGELAAAVEASLLPPLIATTGDGAFTWDTKVSEVPWDITDSPDRKRGTWKSPGNLERLVIPPMGGWYLVNATVTFKGKGEADYYDVSIRTRQTGSTVGTGTVWGRVVLDVPNTSTDDSTANITAIVRLPDTTPDTGFTVRCTYRGTTVPPLTSAGANRLRAYRLSAL